MNELTASKHAILAASFRRRRFIAGLGASGALLALPGCASLGEFSLIDAVRRLLFLSSERAFGRMLAPGGYWDAQIAALGLNNLLGTQGDLLSRILTSSLFRDRLQDAFADIALKGAERAAPIVTDAVRVIGISNALALINGGPAAATDFLRQDLDGRLIEMLIPELGDAMRIAQEPLVREVLAGLTGVNVSSVAQNVARNIDDAIWREIGFEEAEIRRNPRSTNDPVLIGVLGGGLAGGLGGGLGGGRFP